MNEREIAKTGLMMVVGMIIIGLWLGGVVVIAHFVIKYW